MMVSSQGRPRPQRLIAEVVDGRYRGRKAVLEPGQSVQVGADVPATLIVPKDRKLSKTHFELSWDGVHCRVRDLKSVNGTLLAGESVQEATVPHSSWIRAGATDFMVYYEHQTPRLSDDGEPFEPDTPEVAEQKQAALAKLRALETPLYAVLDAARARQVRILLQESAETYRSLYDGLDGELLEDVAAYLVRLPGDSVLLEKLVMQAWGNRWGIFLTSELRLDDVRRQLRRFLMVLNGENNERMYFRYYDPWVMNVFMRAATVQQREAFEKGITVLSLGEPGLAMQWHAGNDEGNG